MMIALLRISFFALITVPGVLSMSCEGRSSTAQPGEDESRQASVGPLMSTGKIVFRKYRLSGPKAGEGFGWFDRPPSNQLWSLVVPEQRICANSDPGSKGRSKTLVEVGADHPARLHWIHDFRLTNFQEQLGKEWYSSASRRIYLYQAQTTEQTEWMYEVYADIDGVRHFTFAKIEEAVPTAWHRSSFDEVLPFSKCG